MYYEALALVGFDPSGAYVSLVSAIESLAGHYYKDRVFDFDTVEKFRRVLPLLNDIATLPNGKALTDSLKQELVHSEHFLFQKFALFIADHLPADFWRITDELYPHCSVFPPIDQKNLRWCLRQIYDARSAYVHTGEPFPRYVEFGLRAQVPVDVAFGALGEIISSRADRYFPPFSWFERATHLVFIEYLRRSFAPELIQAGRAQAAEKERLLAVIRELPEHARKCLEKLMRWTARFLGYSIINPYAPNKDWADNAETIEILVEAGLIGSKGEGLQGASWIKNREVGEVVGEFFFGVENNPFRGNEILLPKNWTDISARDEDAAASDE